MHTHFIEQYNGDGQLIAYKSKVQLDFNKEKDRVTIEVTIL